MAVPGIGVGRIFVAGTDAQALRERDGFMTPGMEVGLEAGTKMPRGGDALKNLLRHGRGREASLEDIEDARQSGGVEGR